jgi:hypothetical protein
MAEFWQAVHIRGQQSIGVWGTFAAAFQVGDLTLALHSADVTLILTHVNERDVQDDVFDDAKLARDQNFDLIYDVVTRVPQLIDAVLDDADPLNNDLDDVFTVDPDGQHGCMERARRVISLWNRVNAKRAAMAPPLPALLLGTTAVADLTTALNNHPGLLQTVENERSELSQKKSQLQATARRVDRNNKRWYGAWANNFADGSPEKNALSGVDTEEGTNPPTALEIDTVTQSGLSVAVAYVAGGGNHATSLMLQWQVVGVDAEFGHDTPVILTGQTVGPFTAGATVNFRVRATNSAGTTDSAVKTITLI